VAAITGLAAAAQHRQLRTTWNSRPDELCRLLSCAAARLHMPRQTGTMALALNPGAAIAHVIWRAVHYLFET